MNYDKVVIKQIPDSNSASAGLEKYGRSRFPGTFERLQVPQLPDGRYVTGLSEELSSSLGNLIGENLAPNSDFWERFYVTLSSDQDLILSKNNPQDIIKYHVLTKNGYVAPSKEESSNPEYINSKYYCHIDEVENTQKISNRKLIDKAKAELYKIENNKEMLYLIGSYLEGSKYKKTMTANTLYLNLSDFIEDKKNPENIDSFIKATKVSVEDLQYKVIIETSIRKKIIKFKEGQYYRGIANLGKTVLEVMNNLKQPEYANEFIQIHEEVNQK